MLIPNHFPEDPRFYLKAELSKRSDRRPYYSMRAFARDLEIGASTLSEFLNGKSGLSPERAKHLSKKMGLDKMHQEHFIDLVIAKYSMSTEQRAVAKSKVSSRVNNKTSRISIEEFKYISEWQHLAMLEYLELRGVKFEVKKAAKDFNLTRKDIEVILQRLLSLGLIHEADSKFTVNSDSTFTPNDVPNEAMKHFHNQLLKKAKVSLEKDQSFQREMAHVLFSIYDRDIPELKNDLRNMYMQLASKYNAKPNKNKVYCLGVQFYQLVSGDDV